jgi:hypothetical protein
MWLMRCCSADVAVGERPDPSSVVPIASPFLSLAPVCAGRLVRPSKNPRRSGEGSGRFGLASSALVPASSLPPGAGNEYEYALNAELERAKQTKEGYVDQAQVLHRNLHATTIRPDQDGDVAAVPTVEQTQPGSP